MQTPVLKELLEKSEFGDIIVLIQAIEIIFLVQWFCKPQRIF